MSTTARQVINDFLRNYGLTYQAATIDRWARQVAEDPNNMVLVEEEIRQSNTFKRRFPGLQSRLDNGYNQISVDEYLALENQYKSIMRSAGLPRSFYDSPADLGRFIANDVSAQELETRVARGVVAARNAPQEVRDALERFYGITNTLGTLTAYYLNPSKALPVIEREFATANISGAGAVRGFDTERDLALRLVQLGYTEFQQGLEGFGRAESLRGIQRSTVTESDTLADEDLIGAGFGFDGDATNRINRRVQRRQGQMQGQGAGGGITQQRGTALGGSRRR